MPARDEEELLRLAESVTDGRPVNWDVESSTDETFRKRVNRLRILESIGAASGMPPASPGAPAEASSDPAGAQPGSRSPVLDRWGHLEILELIGDGVFGVVHRAWETTLDREVAVKFLRPEPTPGSFAKHMLQEGRTMARVRHPNVIAVYGAEQLGGRVGIWMEYVHGRTLEDILQERGTFGAREAAMIGIDLCRALAAVHHARLVHRDVKTKNVMREEGGRIVLMDFGTGVEARPDASFRAAISAGTPMYQAPEVLDGAPASPQSDLFSLGVLLYRLVTRSYPVEASRLEDLKAAYERHEVKLLRDVRPDLPAAFAQVVERALATAPEERFASAGQMEAALAATLAGPERLAGEPGTGSEVTTVAPMPDARPTTSGDTGRAAPAVPWFRSRTALAVAAIVVALGVVLVVLRARTPPAASRGARMAVAVADIDNDTAERELDGLAGMFTTSLEQSHELSVLTRSRMGDILTQLGREKSDAIDEGLGREICKRARVGALVVPSIRKFDDLYTIDLVVLDPLRDRYRFTVREQAQGRQQIPATIDVLSAKVYAELMERPAAAPIAAASVAAITTDDLDAYHHYYEAERHIDRLEMQAARQSLETAVSLDTTFGLAYCRLAYVDWWASDFERERQHLKKATSLIHRIPEKERYRLRAQVAMSEQQGLEAARSILLEMARFYPDDKEMLYDIGDYSSHLSEYPVAVQYLEKAVEADPGFVRALLHLARCYRDMGRGPELLEWAQRYAAAETSWESAALLGDAQIATGDWDGGMRTLVTARSRYSDYDLQLTMPIARAHIARGDCDSAEAEWHRFLGSSHPLWNQRCGYEELGFLYAYQGRYREALATMDRAIAVARQDDDPVRERLLHLNKALLSVLGWNDWAAAGREIETSAVEADRVTYASRYFEYWPYWGRHLKLRLLGGDLAGAETLAKQKFSMEKWYGPYVGAYLQGARGECAQAEASSSTMLTWGPAGESLELLYFLARCQVEEGRHREAVASLRRLKDLYGPLQAGSVYYTKGLVLLGQAYENLGEVDLARETYTELTSIWERADADLPDLIDVRQRLSRLRSPAVRE